MPPPSRDQIEQIAFMAMMDGMIHTNVQCNCPTCKSDKARGGTRPSPARRTGSDSTSSEPPKSASKSDTTANCSHKFSESKAPQSTKKMSAVAPSQNKSNSAPSSGRSDKVNALLKADSVPAVLEVFNMTTTSKDEKDLAARIQNATKDCKLYQETKDKIVELCDDDDIDLDAVFGLLAKFRYERNILTTAVIKGNSEREKALLCIQRVDHLMYMLQDVAKKKDSKGTDVMHKLGDIIMEIHDLAKTPSTLYDEFLDIKEEHFDLLNDHEEMHQKFVDVNSCHEKLHSSHDKLQTEHSKLLRDLTDVKKKASAVGALKNDITRLEKAVDKSNLDNAELKKENEKLVAELAKVNALKHENAQLKKKVTTLSTQPPSPSPLVEEQPPAPQSQAGRKKKGKKAVPEGSASKTTAAEPTSELESKSTEPEKVYEEQITMLKKAHDTVSQELEGVRTSIAQLNKLVRKAENARDQAVEKLDVEKATSQNWKDIAQSHSTERDRLQSELDRYVSRATKLQSSVEELAQTLKSTKSELAEQAEAYKHVKDELEQRAQTPAPSVASQQTSSLSSDMLRLLRKIKSETGQLVREIDESKSFNGDVFALLEIIQITVRRVVTQVERDIEEILSVKGNDLHTSGVPETVQPFAYGSIASRHTPQYSHRPDYSPQESPRVSSSTSLPPYRPMIPPGFNELPSGAFGRGMESPSTPFSRIVEPPGFGRTVEPPGFSRTIEPPSAPRYNATPSSFPASLHTAPPPPNPGVIGSRSTNSRLNNTPSPGTTPAPSTGSGVSGSGLGNGAVGVDWNMWAKTAR